MGHYGKEMNVFTTTTAALKLDYHGSTESSPYVKKMISK